MKFSRSSALAALLCASLAFTGVGCKSLKDITSALTDLRRLQFKLDRASNFAVNGVDVSRITQPSQISVTDAARLLSLFTQKSLPVNFTLNVQARNPNTGQEGTRSTPLYLRRIAWTLLIDDRTTINGVTDQQLEIPGSGQSVNIPITMSLDLYKFFGDRGLNDLLNLALAIGGANGSSSHLKLTSRISVQTPLGVVDYPGDITIVDTQFSN